MAYIHWIIELASDSRKVIQVVDFMLKDHEM